MDIHEHQARLALATAIATRNPGQHRAAREAAATKLIREFQELAKAEGFQTGATPDGSECVGIGVTYVLMPVASGEIYLRHKADQTVGPPERAKLAFDYITGNFIGEEVDHEMAPTPGEPLPRVNALVTLARQVAKLLEPTKTSP